MSADDLNVIDIAQQALAANNCTNIPVAKVNDHVIRMSVMTQTYFWHYHPDSDETFLVIEGSVFIELGDRTIELFPNQLFTIPKNVKHRTGRTGRDP